MRGGEGLSDVTSWAIVIEALLLACALAMDSLIASIAYGSKQIKMPIRSGVTLNAICGILLGISLLLGKLLHPYIPPEATLWVSFFILLLLGLSKLMDDFTRVLIGRWERRERKEIRFSFFRLKFILHLYANPIEADLDASKSISPMEALWLGVALSLDGLAVGFGAGVTGANPWLLLTLAVTANLCAIFLGFFIGNKLAKRANISISWVSGVLLLLLACSKLIER